ncbi:hypothetical protein [Pseudoprimorskyibacter insulae]|uniref:HTH merR-type domain-containing protein n=1 Tax=Pseudoprimorskyibacter insulae TaxID=1695997 RepID=A0A2R8B116_9RHOB|nr:hypothetical protein [Pseudoprimorskyibacter insulae]SPF81927.1 hypothetical protein PRI8871_03754 [Pseudoprimorskyibacter insulae]
MKLQRFYGPKMKSKEFKMGVADKVIGLNQATLRAWRRKGYLTELGLAPDGTTAYLSVVDICVLQVANELIHIFRIETKNAIKVASSMSDIIQFLIPKVQMASSPHENGIAILRPSRVIDEVYSVDFVEKSSDLSMYFALQTSSNAICYDIGQTCFEVMKRFATLEVRV